MNQLAPIASHLEGWEDAADPVRALNLKKGLEPLTKFDQAAPISKEAMGVARQVYHAADEAIDKEIPRSNELNDKIHSLMTIAKPKGKGGMGMGKYALPWAAGKVGQAVAGPIGELGAMGLTYLGEAPTSRIALGKAIAKSPVLGRVARRPLLDLTEGQ